jgi:hypothetical protein
MTDYAAYHGFGAPDRLGVHLFRVDIPLGRGGFVRIFEDYGYRGLEGGGPQDEPRVDLPRKIWTAIAEAARTDFNTRLKALKLPVGRWRTGSNYLDRLLGRELCVLAWAAETASPEEFPVICARWAALRPEERWWLFGATVAEAGRPGDFHRGWRRALYFALADGKSPAPKVKRAPRPVEKEPVSLPLFGGAL